MESEWIQVRVRRATYARLRTFGQRALRLIQQGRLESELNGKTKEVAADVLISILLDRDDKAQARNRKRGNQQ